MNHFWNGVFAALLLAVGFGIGVFMAPKVARAPAQQPSPAQMAPPLPAPVVALPPPPQAPPAMPVIAPSKPPIVAPKPFARPPVQKSKKRIGRKRASAKPVVKRPGKQKTAARLKSKKSLSAARRPPPPIPKAALHAELIPRDIKVVRLYYSQGVAVPGAGVSLDINGAGFNSAFREIISIDPGSPDIRVSSLKLVTANQIHAELEISPGAKTAYASAKIMIKGLPVFQAEEPLAVVREGEVLDVKIIEFGADGRTATFRATTNLTDDNMARQFWVEPTVDGLTVEGLQPKPPYFVDGTLSFKGASLGKYGVRVTIFSKEVFRAEDIGVIVPSNIGRRGRTQKIVSERLFHRPSDVAVFDLKGNHFDPKDLATITARIEGIPAARAKLAYVSASLIKITAPLPKSVKEGSYGVIVEGPDNKVIQRNKDVFTVVPPQWIGDIRVEPQAKPGAASSIRINGRDFTPQFASALTVETDDFDLKISNLRLQDPSTLIGDVTVGAAVAPGDYLLRLSADGRPIQPQAGALIAVR